MLGCVSGACVLRFVVCETHMQTPWALERGGGNLTLDTFLNLAEYFNVDGYLFLHFYGVIKMSSVSVECDICV